MDGVTPTQIDMEPLEGCDFSLCTRDENIPSGKAIECPGPPMMGEAMRPVQELSSVPEQGAHTSECRELDMDPSLELYYPPVPHELSTASLGDQPLTLDPVGT